MTYNESSTLLPLRIRMSTGYTNLVFLPAQHWLKRNQALRGAAERSFFTLFDWRTITKKPSIGIITTFYLQTQPAPSSIVNWAYTVPISSPNVAATAFSHIHSFALNASVIGGKIGFGVSPKPSSFYISGTYRGDPNTFKSKVSSGNPTDDPSWVRDAESVLIYEHR